MTNARTALNLSLYLSHKQGGAKDSRRVNSNYKRLYHFVESETAVRKRRDTFKPTSLINACFTSLTPRATV